MLQVFARVPYQLLPPGQVCTVRSVYQPLPTSLLLNGLRRCTNAISGGSEAANTGNIAALEQSVSMTFPDPTPLQDVLNYVTRAMATSTHLGIPIYLDPIGLQVAEMTPTSKVKIDLLGVPLKTSLSLCLDQLGLDYHVRDGCLRVTCKEDVPTDLDGPNRIAYNPRWNIDTPR
jgi:hypothetical protein